MQLVHTLCCRKHILLRTSAHLHTCEHRRMGSSLVKKKVFAVCMSHISISPSLSSCFIRRPCCSRTVTSTARSRPAPSSSSFTRPQSVGQAHFSTSAEEFGYLAAPTHSTGDEPKQPDKTASVHGDTTPINDPDHGSISDFLKTTRENTGLFGVPSVWIMVLLLRQSSVP